jgi:hypothetical protein
VEDGVTPTTPVRRRSGSKPPDSRSQQRGAPRDSSRRQLSKTSRSAVGAGRCRPPGSHRRVCSVDSSKESGTSPSSSRRLSREDRQSGQPLSGCHCRKPIRARITLPPVHSDGEGRRPRAVRRPGPARVPEQPWARAHRHPAIGDSVPCGSRRSSAEGRGAGAARSE